MYDWSPFQMSIQADFHAKYNNQKSECMEESARIIAKAFGNCMTDRYSKFVAFRSHVHSPPTRMSPPDQSRKWGVYYVVGLVLKCYFRASFLWWKSICVLSEICTGQTNITVEEHPKSPWSKFRHTSTLCIPTVTPGMLGSLWRYNNQLIRARSHTGIIWACWVSWMRSTSRYRYAF